MWIVTAKIPRRKSLFAALLAAAGCALLVLTIYPGSSQTVSAPVRPDPKGVRTNADRVAYLEAWGWQVLSDPLSVQELVIPAQLDGSYEEYLAMQAAQGFDLSKYAGKRIKRYTYQVTNHPRQEDLVQADLLLYRSTVVGGEVLSPRLDGFLHGLDSSAVPEKNGV